MDNIKHKGIIIVMGLWIVEKFGLLGPLLFVLCILMLVDYFSGMLAAKKEALEHPGNISFIRPPFASIFAASS